MTTERAPEHLWVGPDGEQRVVNDHVAATLLGSEWKRAPEPAKKVKADDRSGGARPAQDSDGG